MPPRVSWFKFSHRMSALCTEKLGLTTDERCYIVKGVEYLPARLREVVALCKKKFPDETLNVLDIGCGRYSYFQTLQDHSAGLLFHGMDVSGKELENNALPMKQVVHDACDTRYEEKLRDYKGFFHLVISNSFLEHVADADVTHSMIAYVLKPGGLALHEFSTLYDPLLFVGNLFPSKLIEKLVLLFEPWRKSSGKFKTYYRKCRGDSGRMRRWFDARGFNCLEYRMFYGSGYFYAFFPVQWVLNIFYWLIIKLRISFFTSNAVITLEKKDADKPENKR